MTVTAPPGHPKPEMSVTAFRQTRTIVDRTGRPWTTQLTGWGTAMAGDLRNRNEHPPPAGSHSSRTV